MLADHFIIAAGREVVVMVGRLGSVGGEGDLFHFGSFE
jgi:hypothetical protein